MATAMKTYSELVNEIVARPYARVLEREEGGGYSASILEFPGCYTDGEDAVEAMDRLDDALRGYVQVLLDSGKPIPEPIAAMEFTGRVSLRIAPALHREATRLAAAMGVSLERFLADAVSRQVGALSAKD